MASKTLHFSSPRYLSELYCHRQPNLGAMEKSLGDRAKRVVTGDITQVDLPVSRTSGLKQAVQVLSSTEGIKLFYFESKDVVRHSLVETIINAYDHFLNNGR